MNIVGGILPSDLGDAHQPARRYGTSLFLQGAMSGERSGRRHSTQKSCLDRRNRDELWQPMAKVLVPVAAPGAVGGNSRRRTKPNEYKATRHRRSSVESATLADGEVRERPNRIHC